MKHIFIFSVIIFLFHYSKIEGQHFEIKCGPIFYHSYDINNVHLPEPYYYDAKYNFHTGFIFSVGSEFSISKQIKLISDLRFRNLNGKAENIFIGYSPFDSSKVFKSWEFKFINLETTIKLGYVVYHYNNLKIAPFMGVGYSYNLSFERSFVQTKIAKTPADYPIIYIEEPPHNNSGLLVNLGLDILYQSVIINIGGDIGLFKTHIYEAGNFKLVNTYILIGFRL